MIGKVLVGAAAAVISVGLAAPAGASPAPQPLTVPNFLAAARAAGVTGTAIPNGEGEPWLQMTCAEVTLAWQRTTTFEVTGCDGEEPMSLDPP